MVLRQKENSKINKIFSPLTGCRPNDVIVLNRGLEPEKVASTPISRSVTHHYLLYPLFDIPKIQNEAGMSSKYSRIQIILQMT